MHISAERCFRAAIVAFAIGVGVAANGYESALAGGGACHQPPEKMDEAGTLIRMSRNCFSPAVLRAEAGETVRFQNDDELIHHIAGVANEWGTIGSTVGVGGGAEFTFAQPGTYPYSCNFHVGMTGAIVVGDGVGSGASAPPVEKLVQEVKGPGTGTKVEPSSIGSAALASEDADTNGTLLAGLAGAIGGAVAVMAAMGIVSLRKQ